MAEPHIEAALDQAIKDAQLDWQGEYVRIGVQVWTRLVTAIRPLGPVSNAPQDQAVADGPEEA